MTRVADAFGASAERYERAEMSRYIPDIVLGLCAPEDDDRVLDLGCGPGTLTRILQPHVASVVGADVTPEMLERYRMRTSGLPVMADAARPSFGDGSFTLVVCGSVFHHLPDPPGAIAEVARVLRSGGRFLLIDMAGPEDPRRREIRDRVERARDPSHGAILAPSQVRAWLSEAGLEPVGEERQAEDKRDAEWVELMGGDLASVREMLRTHQADAAGFLALRRDGDAYRFRRERRYYLAVKR